MRQRTFRWDAAEGHPLLQELRDFLGPTYRPYLDSSRALRQRWAQEAPSAPQEIIEFFGGSDDYLYNLVIWHASGHRPDYVSAAAAHLPAGSRILDFAAGVGQDALALAASGHHVTACEVPGPCSDFLEWRSQTPAIPLDFVTPSQLDSARPDTLWIIDTLDHLPDIGAALSPTPAVVERVICEHFGTLRTGGQGFHVRRPFADLAATFASFGLHAVATQPSHLTLFGRRP